MQDTADIASLFRSLAPQEDQIQLAMALPSERSNPRPGHVVGEGGGGGSAGGSLPARMTPEYMDRVPIERRLSRTGISHPGYRWQVYDPKTNTPQGSLYTNSSRARSRVDQLDNNYGSYRYKTREVPAPNLTEEEQQFLRDMGLAP